MVGFVEALKRQSGAQKVVIDYQHGSAEALWKKDARLEYERIKQAVRKSADLTLRSVVVTARGSVTGPEGRPALQVTGTDEVFLLYPDGAARGTGTVALDRLLAASRSGAGPFLVTGTIQEGRKRPGERTDPTPLVLAVSEFAPGGKAR